MATKSKLNAAQERAAAAFFEELGDKPFRRADLAAVLRRHTRPQLTGNSLEAADMVMGRLKAERKLEKAGHVHWRVVRPENRKLLSGRSVAENSAVTDLSLKTHCPDKWVVVDLETGEVLAGGKDGWKSATKALAREAADLCVLHAGN
ncbi:hypothetical protein KTD31_02040 [Burkholderia multivorans]|jgi:hypothetical protein|uniref:hypothetical protein n=1 Tax=Burkholderia multivorans TaxID=87883 RepID=UPI001C217377|nr:hypothetical protein [Burkholderia multivorans]MBU9200185.1 hypothetical protein [Burkholderia multivorans]MDN8078691.1 hypothetical protein [Burkholderia multivorans]